MNTPFTSVNAPFTSRLRHRRHVLDVCSIIAIMTVLAPVLYRASAGTMGVNKGLKHCMLHVKVVIDLIHIWLVETRTSAFINIHNIVM